VGNPARPTIPSPKANSVRMATALLAIQSAPREGLAPPARSTHHSGDNDIDCEYNGPVEVGLLSSSGTYGSLSTQSPIESRTVTAGGSGTPGSHVTLGGTQQCRHLQSPSGTTLWGAERKPPASPLFWRSRHRHTITGTGRDTPAGASCTLTRRRRSGAACSASPPITTLLHRGTRLRRHAGWDFATGIGQRERLHWPSTVPGDDRGRPHQAAQISQSTRPSQ